MTNTIHYTADTDLSAYMLGDDLVVRDIIATCDPADTHHAALNIPGIIHAYLDSDDLPTLVVQDARAANMLIYDDRAPDAVLDALKGISRAPFSWTRSTSSSDLRPRHPRTRRGRGSEPDGRDQRSDGRSGRA